MINQNIELKSGSSNSYTNLLDVNKYKRSQLIFHKTNNGYRHNYDRDIQFIILWENGRGFEKKVINQVNKNFKILHCANVQWTQENKRSNFNRLYSQISDSNLNLSKHKQVGMGDFLCIIFEDVSPVYKYLQSLNGEISLKNINVIKIKYELRKLLENNFIHSSSGIDEFFHHASLIFHHNHLFEILNLKKWDSKIYNLKQDLAGANGWESFEEMISIANFCDDWVILRNYEYLPNNFWGNDKDLDILCRNSRVFASSINAIKRKGGMSAYETKVDLKPLLVDIRFLGDFYYDSIWENNMLLNKEYKNDILPILSNDNYFFSLLYHIKLQKKEVKSVYIQRLIDLGHQIGIYEIDEDRIADDKYSVGLINGYLHGQKYCFYKPNDRSVFINKNALKYITAIPQYSNITFKKKIAKTVNKIIPKSIKSRIPRTIKNILLR